MKYSDLVQFAPIDAVVELRAADSADAARRLVETFVISERMGELLCDVVVPQLVQAGDPRGLLVVGNYGTGKSHLMAVLSAVAEHRELAARLTDPRVAEHVVEIAGAFKVIRVEIGATRMGLRDILCGALADGLAGLGVAFTFPSASARHENKTALAAMMAAFHAVHADRGLLLVVDELLDFLRSRDERELGLDLAFLRELGEACGGSWFRVIAGVQESLFEHPRLQVAADALRRVKDRFEAVRIAREDVAFVVAERLLKKDGRQQALVREHLLKFCPLYGGMRERLDEFVRLFPVHPAYLTMVDRIMLAEQRDVLKTLSAEIRQISGADVPGDAPGLIAYDAYLKVLRDSPVLRAVPEVRAVLERCAALAGRVQQGLARPQYRAVALRIVHALAVQRLTTDLHAPVGVTAEQLRDDLCLLLPLPEREAEFLRTIVEAVLREVVRAVSGQFISFNNANGQYYLDLEKGVDFDALIERRGAELDERALDRCYFDALQGALVAAEAPCVRGHRCWPFEVVWRERGAGREGYLCLGAPSERPTSLAAREFFLQFVEVFGPAVEARGADEVVVRLVRVEDGFVRALRLYGGARELAATASGNKKIYEGKASEHLRAVTGWLRDNLALIEVVHLGRGRSLLELVEDTRDATLRECVKLAGARVLASYFAETCPEHPRFAVVITRENRAQAALEALRGLAGGSRGALGAAVLRGLELDGEGVRGSRYAREVLALLDLKGPGQVLNRGELVRAVGGREMWARFGLELEFLIIVLAALVGGGDVVVNVAGERIDAGGLGRLVHMGVARAGGFDWVERPREVLLGPLEALCELLAVPRGLVVDAGTRDEAAVQIQRRVRELLGEVVTAQARMGELVVWGRPLPVEAVQRDWRARLAGLKAFLESLQAFDAAGKLRDFPHDAATVRAQTEGLALLREVEELGLRVRQVAPLAAYLGRAELLLAASHPWQEQARAARVALMAGLGGDGRGAAVSARSGELDPPAALVAGLGDSGWRAALVAVQVAYQDAYLQAHARARLGVEEEARRDALVADPRLALLRELAIIELLPGGRLRGFIERLVGLLVCTRLTRDALEVDPMCPHCGYRPAEESDAVGVSGLAEELAAMVEAWTRMLLEGLAQTGERISEPAVLAFVDSGKLPETASPALLEGLREALQGVERVEISGEELRSALAGDGSCALAELRERLERHILNKIAGRDAAKVRVVIE